MARTTGNAKDLITFTRASTGTFLGSNGLLQTAAINTPRVEYDANGVAKGLLIEEARTNLMTYSQDINNSTYPNKQGLSTIVPNAISAPDGSITASKLVVDNQNTLHRVIPNTGVISGGHTLSVFAKAAEYTHAWLWINGDGLFRGVTFDLSNGTVSGNYHNLTTNIVPLDNGWYRLSIYYSNAANAGFGPADQGYSVQNVLQFQGDGSSGVYFWGAQLEAGSFPTSYIPTSGATATRSADLASVSVSEFGYNQAQGSVVINFEIKGIDTNWYPHLFEFSDLTTANRLQAYHHFNGGRVAQGFSGGATQFSFSNFGSLSTNTAQKWALGVKQNDFFVAATGNQTVSDTSGAMPVSISTLNVGTSYTSSSQLNGYIKSINYYPLRLSDAKLQELTS